MQFQTHDDTGYIEIETGGSVFYRDCEGDERYLEWDSLHDELLEFLSSFFDDAETTFNEAMAVLNEASAEGLSDDENGDDED